MNEYIYVVVRSGTESEDVHKLYLTQYEAQQYCDAHECPYSDDLAFLVYKVQLDSRSEIIQTPRDTHHKMIISCSIKKPVFIVVCNVWDAEEPCAAFLSNEKAETYADSMNKSRKKIDMDYFYDCGERFRVKNADGRDGYYDYEEEYYVIKRHVNRV